MTLVAAVTFLVGLVADAVAIRVFVVEFIALSAVYCLTHCAPPFNASIRASANLTALFAEPLGVKEAVSYQAHTQGTYTVDDYRALPEDQRVELIDGVFYDMVTPPFLHQRIVGEIYRQIANFIMERGGSCQPFVSPVDVQLDCDEKTMVQPDVGILCHEDKIKKWGVYGAPDFVLEIISPSTKRKDCTKKLSKYMDAGVREYWILDPYQKKLIVYFFESELCPVIYGLDEPVPIAIYDGALEIRFEHIKRWIEEA